MKKQFLYTKFYKGANADKLCELGKNIVLFENVCVTNSKIGNYTYIQSN